MFLVKKSKMKGDIGIAWSTKGYYTAKLTKATPISLSDTLPMNKWNKDIGMVSCSFVYICCVITLVSSFLVLQAIPTSPIILKKLFFHLFQLFLMNSLHDGTLHGKVKALDASKH